MTDTAIQRRQAGNVQRMGEPPPEFLVPDQEQRARPARVAISTWISPGISDCWPLRPNGDGGVENTPYKR